MQKMHHVPLVMLDRCFVLAIFGVFVPRHFVLGIFICSIVLFPVLPLPDFFPGFVAPEIFASTYFDTTI